MIMSRLEVQIKKQESLQQNIVARFEEQEKRQQKILEEQNKTIVTRREEQDKKQYKRQHEILGQQQGF